MNWKVFLAQRIYQTNYSGKRLTQPAIRIAIAGVAIGLFVMLLSVSIVVGFQQEIRAKIIGLGSDVVVTGLRGQTIYEMSPIAGTDSLLQSIRQLKGVSNVQRTAHKAGMIMTKDNFQAMMLKGVAQEYDWSFLQKHLVSGTIPTFTDTVASRQVLISQPIAQRLQLKIGDKLDTYYLEESVRTRRLEVVGTYQTGMPMYDDFFLITDLYTVCRLNNWEEEQVGGIEIKADPSADATEINETLREQFGYQTDRYGEFYLSQTAEDIYPQIFDWLALLDINIAVILVLMIGVSGFTIISGLLIIILERTNMIGILKALGANNKMMREVFLTLSVFLIGRGMLWGNLLFVVVWAVQHFWKVFPLDASIYYLDAVPVHFHWGWFLVLNIFTLLVSILILVAPSYLISRIHPARSIRFE